MQRIDRRAFNTGLFFGLGSCRSRPSPRQPDLVVTALRWSEDDGATWHTEPIRAGSNVWFEADVKNQGTGPTPEGVIVGVAFRVDGTMASWSDTHTRAIPAGATVSLRASGGPDGDRYWNNVPAGAYTVRAHVDDVNRIPDELDKTNNILDVPVTVESAGGATPDGQFGLSYENPPFNRDVTRQSWGSSPGLTATQLFWEVGNHFTDASRMKSARDDAARIEASGRIPRSGAQRWRQSWVYAMPRSYFTNPPSWVDERHYNDANHAASYRAWGQWIADRPQYWDRDKNGNPPQSDWNSFGGHWGHISPPMPLDPADIIPGMEGDTYGDWFAHKWGEVAGLCGAWGIQLSDFVDGHPHQLTTQHDFNPRIVDRFETWLGQTIPGSTIAARASYIVANFPLRWTDFWSEAYGTFYLALVREVERNTGHFGMIQLQDSRWPARQRFSGIDHRILFTKIPPSQVITVADYRTMQSDRGGEPPSFAMASTGTSSARNLAMRLGPTLHCWSEQSPSFSGGLDKHFPQYTGATKTEFGDAWLKRLWFGCGWLHVAGAGGTVRRGVAWFQRGYHDSGSVDGNWMAAIRGVIPARPFGFAVYYSVAMERAWEQWWVTTGQSNQNLLYMATRKLYPLMDTDRVPFNYYVSDAGLGNLQPSAYPSAWIVLDRYHPQTGEDLLPAAERQALEAVAPILDNVSAIQAFDSPLRFSANAIGYGFGDQHGRLIVVSTNLTSSTLNATVTVKTLADGNYKATDLLSGAVINFSSSSGTASVPVTLSRWDTRALAITPSSGG